MAVLEKDLWKLYKGSEAPAWPAGQMWEFAEWAGNNYITNEISVGYEDTLGDIAAGGAGSMVAGVALDLVRFPTELGQTVGAVLPADVQFRLVLVWGPVPAVIAIVALLIFVSYNITRARHAEIAAALGRGQAPG